MEYVSTWQFSSVVSRLHSKQITKCRDPSTVRPTILNDISFKFQLIVFLSIFYILNCPQLLTVMEIYFKFKICKKIHISK